MPFEECTTRAFTQASVQNNAPECSGVYGLSNNREWVYIGEADNIRAHLIAHLDEVGTSVSVRRPTGFRFEPCAAGSRTVRHSRLVRKFAPYVSGRS
jgi:hypothetical protein